MQPQQLRLLPCQLTNLLGLAILKLANRIIENSWQATKEADPFTPHTLQAKIGQSSLSSPEPEMLPNR